MTSGHPMAKMSVLYRGTCRFWAILGNFGLILGNFGYLELQYLPSETVLSGLLLTENAIS